MPDLKDIVDKFRPKLSKYEELYKHFHAHPELSLQEEKTALKLQQELSALSSDFDLVTEIGSHGFCAILNNGPGKTILLRADMDGLPVEEKTGLPYASRKRMVDNDGVEKATMHACGHDMHITSLLAAGDLLLHAREHWSGTLILLFQPAEERGAGAKAMVEGGLYRRVPVPDVVLGAHVMPYRAGTLGTKRGLMASAADSMRITMFGRGGHASMPDRTIDPVVMAASTVMKLQTIVSREIASDDIAVVTVGAIKAGHTENIISDEAELRINVRSTNSKTRDKVLSSVKRIVTKESEASNAVKQPEFVNTSSFPFTINNDEVTGRLEDSFSKHFGESYNPSCPRLQGSEDFGILGSAVKKPYCFWIYGGVDPETWDKAEKEGRTTEDIPINHSPFFTPVIQPTLTTGVDAYAVAALTWLAKQ